MIQRSSCKGFGTLWELRERKTSSGICWIGRISYRQPITSRHTQDYTSSNSFASNLCSPSISIRCYSRKVHRRWIQRWRRSPASQRLQRQLNCSWESLNWHYRYDFIAGRAYNKCNGIELRARRLQIRACFPWMCRTLWKLMIPISSHCLLLCARSISFLVGAQRSCIA